MDMNLLRGIPKVDILLSCEILTDSHLPEKTVAEAVRQTLQSLREGILSGAVTELPPVEALAREALALAQEENRPSLRSVINATGVVLHTNLGRARLSEAATAAVRETAGGYCNLEYEIASGQRGSRYSHVESLLTRLTGAESALVVNNNAAAVLLLLSALAQGGEVIVSRGELVEIGGSFRVPEIMESCGAMLREAGTTNKTRLNDYARAITDRTRALMKVHTSNYRIVGFTESVDRASLVALAHENGLPALEDLGSGCLTDLKPLGVLDEPTVQESLASGMDVVTFSADKLLGGPQAGILAGKKEYIDILKKHPLLRAMRVDKMTLAALEATLKSYLNGTEKQDIPTLRMLFTPAETLKMRAERCAAVLNGAGVRAEAVAAEGCVGGGSLPAFPLPDYAVAVTDGKLSADTLERALRLRQPAVIARVEKDRLLLHMRTLTGAEEDTVIAALTELLV